MRRARSPRECNDRRIELNRPCGRLGLVPHPRSDPTPVVERLTTWARSHRKQVIVGAHHAPRVPGDVEPLSEAELLKADLADQPRRGRHDARGAAAQESNSWPVSCLRPEVVTRAVRPLASRLGRWKHPFPGPGRKTSLKGRARECALLDGFVAAIRRGESRSLVLRGEAGIGKTALLEYLIESASDLTVVRAVGVESEMELAYASLHQLCAPLLDRLERLPAPQRQAVEIVFGLSSGTAPDRFLVGLGVLSLVAEVAEERPLLCVIDDAQWLDHASALTLAFVARRLMAEPVALVFAARDPGEELRHLPDLEVRGLLNGDARALLGSTMRFALDGRVRDRTPRGDTREPARVTRAATRVDTDAAGRWLRHAGDVRPLETNREELRPTTRDPPRGRATPVARRSGRPGRRSAAVAACVRTPGTGAV